MRPGQDASSAAECMNEPSGGGGPEAGGKGRDGMGGLRGSNGGFQMGVVMVVMLLMAWTHCRRPACCHEGTSGV